MIREWSETLKAEHIYHRTKLAGQTAASKDVAASAPAPITEFQSFSSVVPAPDDYARAGNDVRSAIEQGKKGNLAGSEDRLRSLVFRLCVPLHLNDAALSQWFAVLHPLLEPAAQGFWPVAGRLLYELQKTCIDVERKVFAVDVVETIVSLGQHKLSREITKPREINILKRLRKAAKLADNLEIPIDRRQALSQQLEQAAADAEIRVRDSLRPDLEDVLTEVQLVPQSQSELIAQRKLIEELLDVACAQDF